MKRVSRVEVVVEPDRYVAPVDVPGAGSTAAEFVVMQVRCTADGRTHGYGRTMRQSDFESAFDVILAEAARVLKEALAGDAGARTRLPTSVLDARGYLAEYAEELDRQGASKMAEDVRIVRTGLASL